MAFIQLSFFSNVLDMERKICIALPETGEIFPVLYLYHGYTGTFESWSKDLNIERFAKEKGIAIVMPDAWKSYYTNMVSGERYMDHIANEIPEVVRKLFHLSSKREDNYVAGFSMGGYGALKIALTYPEKFSYAASISGVVDLNSSSMKDTKLFNSIFGENCTFKGSEHDLQQLILKRKEENVTIPKMYICCGTEDDFIDCNRDFADFCKENSVNFQYHEDVGGHDWEFRDPYFEKMLSWIPDKN